MSGDVDRYVGCLVGLAVGDALGTTAEFTAKGSVPRIDDMVGGGPFGLEAGQWTDDTSMALCLAESLIERHGFDPVDQMRRYIKWWREGYLSSKPGDCFDIGTTVHAALRRFEQTGEPYTGSTDPNSAGNGSLMRLAPVPMFYSGDAVGAVVHAALSSKTTHAAAEAIDACRYYAALIVGALRGEAKQALTADLFAPDGVDWTAHQLSSKIHTIATGSYRHRDASSIRATGYVVHTLQAALWAFHESSSFEKGALLAVNLGEDADTTGAVFGQLAGAFYGAAAIPPRWRKKLHDAELIERLARTIHATKPD
jgi:ADP-ribosyl-[dinitrogen reductase] hydrolase